MEEPEKTKIPFKYEPEKIGENEEKIFEMEEEEKREKSLSSVFSSENDIYQSAESVFLWL